MTHEQLQSFVTAVNDALPASMELCIETVDMMRRVAHFRMEQDSKSALVSIPLESLAAMAKDPTAAALDIRRMFAE